MATLLGMSEPDVSQLLSVAQAIEILDSTPAQPWTVRRSLAEAGGHCLAADLVADRDYPPFDKSLMDGFAVRSADVAAAPCELRLVGEISAGAVAARPLNSGETMAIMTGAALPSGADSVVPVEHSQRTSDSTVRLSRSVEPGMFVTQRGGDCRKGDVLLRTGDRLSSARLAVAASVGANELEVFARPRVGVIATGNEIVAIDQTPAPVQIRNSNNIMLTSLLSRLHCDAHDMGIFRDDPLEIRTAIELGVAGNDVLLISGGMSMGEYDFVPRVLHDLGFDLKITKLRIKPGKPFVFATKGKKFVFGLPGNPVSGFCCTLRLVSRVLARLGGGRIIEKWLSCRLARELPANGPREFYQPARLDGDELFPLAWRGSADIYTLAAANALLVRGENEPARSAGETVRALEIPQ
jgi:molybdopterin molybdotransferase